MPQTIRNILEEDEFSNWRQHKVSRHYARPRLDVGTRLEHSHDASYSHDVIDFHHNYKPSARVTSCIHGEMHPDGDQASLIGLEVELPSTE